MQHQTLTQTITILVGDTLADTGMSTTLYIAIALALITGAIIVYRFAARRGYTPRFRGFHIFALLFLALGATSLALNLPVVSAAPLLTLNADSSNLNITIPQGGGTATTSTTITTSTVNATGYNLTAALQAVDSGISIDLQGGNVVSHTPLATGATPLALKSTTEANASGVTDTTDVTLTFTVDGTVTEGTKTLTLVYEAIDNETPIQSFTSAQCSALPVYTGANEDAVRTVADARGGTTRYYRIAKLADNNCWMLDNLRLGSTASTTELTPADSNIASNFTLPMVVFTTEAVDVSTNPGNNFDTPYAYGPVPGDTGEGATNYGYLYNWSAATAGETRTSIASGTAQYSICPAGWRLPTGGDWDSGKGEFADLDRAFGGTGMSAYSGEANIAKWQYTGPFKGVLAGNWYEGFNGQGGWNGPWSSSIKPDSIDDAFSVHSEVDGVLPGFYNGRNAGLAVRCLLS